LPWNASAAQWNEALSAAGGTMVNSGALAEGIPRRSENACYGALYLAPLVSAAVRREPGASPALDPHQFYLPPGQSEPAALSLPELFASGVECGHRGARLELKRQLDVANAQLMDFNAVLEQAKSDYAQLAVQLVATQRGERAQVEAHLRNLETALAAARARIDELEASRIWRATAPLRRGVHSLKVLAAKLRGQWASLRGSRRHVGYALTIVRNEGTRSLARRVWRRVQRPHRYATTSRKAFASEAVIQPLAFLEAEQPAVTIIIPVHGRPLLTYTCLKSVHSNTPTGTYEVIVVDDASPDPAEVALKEVKGVKIVRNEANRGFVCSCNEGAELARGDVLV